MIKSQKVDQPIRFGATKNDKIELCDTQTTTVSLFCHALDYIFLTRPILFFPGWTTLLAGYVASTHNFTGFFNFSFNFVFWDSLITYSFLAFGCAMGGCFILNQLKDVDSDRNNNKLFLLGDGHIPIFNGYLESLLLILLSLIVGFWIKTSFGVTILTFSLVTGYLYNYSPFELKRYPIWGLWANMIMGWLAFVLGWLLTLPYSWEMLISSMPYLFYNTGLYLLTTLPDVKGDLTSKKATFPVKFGFSTTLICSAIAMIAAGLCGYLSGDYFVFIVTIIASPFLLRALLVQTTSSVIVAAKSGIFFLSIGISIQFPLFLGLIIIAYFITRFYYKKRFGYEYPSFRGK